MSDYVAEGARPTDPVGRALLQATKALAAAGGAVCCAMAAMVTVSVTGRYLFSAPVRGDYDLLGIMTGVAVFAFLPYCQMVRGNVIVDFFTTNMPARYKAILDAFGTLLFLIVAIVFTWRLFFGMLQLRDSGEVLASYDFYRWWTVPFNVFCMVMLILAIFYTFMRDLEIAMRRGESAESGADRG